MCNLSETFCSSYVVFGFFASCLRFAQRFSVFRPDFWIWEVTVGPFRRCTIHFQCLHFHPTNFWCEIMNVINVVVMFFLYHLPLESMEFAALKQRPSVGAVDAFNLALSSHSWKAFTKLEAFITLSQMSTLQKNHPVGFRFL